MEDHRGFNGQITVLTDQKFVIRLTVFSGEEMCIRDSQKDDKDDKTTDEKADEDKTPEELLKEENERLSDTAAVSYTHLR